MSTSRQFKPLKAAEPSDADLQAFADRRGMPSLKAVDKPAENSARAVSAPSVATTETDTTEVETTRLAIEVPLYLADQLKRRALDQRCSTRYILLQAIRDAGFEINEADLITDGRRVRR